MPSNIPKPNEVEIDYDYYQRMYEKETSDKAKKMLGRVILVSNL